MARKYRGISTIYPILQIFGCLLSTPKQTKGNSGRRSRASSAVGHKTGHQATLPDSFITVPLKRKASILHFCCRGAGIVVESATLAITIHCNQPWIVLHPHHGAATSLRSPPPSPGCHESTTSLGCIIASAHPAEQPSNTCSPSPAADERPVPEPGDESWSRAEPETWAGPTQDAAACTCPIRRVRCFDLAFVLFTYRNSFAHGSSS